MKKRLLLLMFPVLLAGCATLSGPEEPEVTARVADTRSAQLADATARELAHLARFDPERLTDVEPELRALAAALVGADMTAGTGMDTAEATLPAAPEGFEQATSLRHGIHLASYRIEANAIAGWHQLRARFPATLEARRARLETAEIEGEGAFLRLKAGPYDTRADAEAACAGLEASGAYCLAMDFSGAPLALDE